MKRFILTVVLLSPCFCLQAATFTADVDKTTLTKDDYLTLTLTLTNSDIRLRAEGVDPNIDLTRLARKFDVGQPEAHFRYRTERTHARATSTLKVPLFPKSTGHLTIPSFYLDDLSTESIDVHVLPTPANPTPDMFVKTGLSQASIWVNQSTEIYLDFYYRKAIRSARLGGDLDAEPLKLFVQRLPDTHRTEFYHGISYQVIRRAWSVTPMLKQPYTFFVPDLWIETEDGKRKRFPVEKLSLSVKIPESKSSIPVITNTPVINIEAPDSFIPGNPLSWRYIITAETHPANLPKILPLPESLAGVRLFMEPPIKKVNHDNENTLTQAIYTVTMLPTSQSDIKIPVVKMNYLDAASGKRKEILSPEKTVRIRKVGHLQPSTDILGTVDKANKISQPTPEGSNNDFSWKIASIVMALLWMATMMTWMRSKKKQIVTTQQIDSMTYSSNPILNELLQLLKSRTVEEGIQALQKRGPIDAKILKSARNIQQACYSTLSMSQQEMKKELEFLRHALRKQPRIPQKKTWQQLLMEGHKKQKTR